MIRKKVPRKIPVYEQLGMHTKLLSVHSAINELCADEIITNDGNKYAHYRRTLLCRRRIVRLIFLSLFDRPHPENADDTPTTDVHCFL